MKISSVILFKVLKKWYKMVDEIFRVMLSQVLYFKTIISVSAENCDILSFRFFLGECPVLKIKDIFEQWYNNAKSERVAKICEKIKLCLHLEDCSEEVDSFLQEESRFQVRKFLKFFRFLLNLNYCPL